jgi:hypothetical protein
MASRLLFCSRGGVDTPRRDRFEIRQSGDQSGSWSQQGLVVGFRRHARSPKKLRGVEVVLRRAK